MTTQTINTYTINSHPNKEAVFEWVRNNWHDLADSELQEMVESLKALADYTGGDLDYYVSAVPDQGEFVKITNMDETRLMELKREDCPLTGICTDYVVIQGAQAGYLEEIVINALHQAAEYRYSDEGIQEMLECNEMFFFEDGRAV